jgi:hypothetical protein
MLMRFRCPLSGAPLALATLLLAPAAGAQVVPVRLEPLTELGCEACDGPLLFTAISDLDLNAHEVLVLDSDVPQLRRFTSDGTPLGTFGRHGEGPGEIRTALGAAFRPDGSIEVLDMRNLRATHFTADGELIDTRALPTGAFPLAVVRQERAWIVAGTDFRESTRLYRLRDDVGPLDTLVAFDRDFPGGDGPLAAVVTSLAAGNDGTIYVGSTGEDYRIRRYAPDGRMLDEFARDIPRTPRSPAEIRSIEQRRDRMAARVQEMRRSEGGAIGTPPAVPPERLHFSAHALAVDAADRLWVRTDRGGPDATIFDLFSSDGRYLGELPLSVRVGRFIIRGDRLAGVVVGADEVPRVRLWRIAA